MTWTNQVMTRVIREICRNVNRICPNANRICRNANRIRASNARICLMHTNIFYVRSRVGYFGTFRYVLVPERFGSGTFRFRDVLRFGKFRSVLVSRYGQISSFIR
jgi:hypothetical protein